MKACEAVIAYTPGSMTDDPYCGQVEVGPILYKGSRDWTAPYACTAGAAYVDRQKVKGKDATLAVLTDFYMLVMHQGIDPKIIHDAFLEIDEYVEISTAATEAMQL